MNILVLEDRGSVSYYMVEALISKGHDVSVAYDIPDAKSIWEEQNIDCIIADLNLNPIGLNPVEVSETIGGLLTGWIWLRNHVYRDSPAMRRRTIIYSEYIKDLENTVSPQALDGIARVGKRGATSPASDVLRLVAQIEHGGGGTND